MRELKEDTVLRMSAQDDAHFICMHDVRLLIHGITQGRQTEYSIILLGFGDYEILSTVIISSPFKTFGKRN
jgi:hypothetical protein